MPVSLPVRLWVESDWGIACTRQGRVSEEAVELTHRGQPWRQIPAPGLSLAQGGAVSSVDTTHGEARFDERGLVRARVVIEYGWQSEAQPPTRSVCTYLLERQDP